MNLIAIISIIFLIIVLAIVLFKNKDGILDWFTDIILSFDDSRKPNPDQETSKEDEDDSNVNSTDQDTFNNVEETEEEEPEGSDQFESVYDKTVYIEYIANHCLPGSKYWICNEKIVHSNTISPAIHRGYIFIISECDDFLLLAYETEEVDDSTYLITIRKYGYKKTINEIVSYFESMDDNKRDKLINYKYLSTIINRVTRTARYLHNDQWYRSYDCYCSRFPKMNKYNNIRF